jgi:ribA/ribD-fused uncharacterized protein
MTEAIRGFFGEYRFLSNFTISEVEFEGVRYSTVEHAFQAAKFDDVAYREIIRSAPTPGRAKRLGATRNYPLREGWADGLAMTVMAELVAKKFVGNEHLKKRLLATGNAPLVETNDWGDDTWGDSTTTETPGRNQLGIILTAVRETLRTAEEYAV